MLVPDDFIDFQEKIDDVQAALLRVLDEKQTDILVGISASARIFSQACHVFGMTDEEFELALEKLKQDWARIKEEKNER